MERENQRIAITKRLLKESMLRILREKDLDTVNVTELCREAGINRATFYRHYEIPRDLLAEIQKDIFYELRKQIRTPTTPGEIRQVIEIFCNYLEEHNDTLRLLIRNSSDTDFANFVNDVYLDVWSAYSGISALKNLDQEDMRMLTLYSAGGSYFVLRSWMLGDIRKSAGEMADYIYALLDKTDWNTLGNQFLTSSK